MKKVVLCLSLLFLFWPTRYSKAQDQIRIGYSSVDPHAALVWIAEKRGLYAKYGLHSLLVYVPGGSTNVQALVSGDIDLAQLTAPPGILADFRGADIVYIAMTDDRMEYQLVTQSRIEKPSDLRKGVKLGISRFGSSSDFSLRLLLKKIGVAPEDVTILQIGNESQRLIALKSGEIDGSVFNAPFGLEAKRFNFNILADAGDLGIIYFNTGICGSERFLVQHQGRVLNFLRAYLEAIKIFKTEPEYVLEALAQFTGVDDPAVLKEAYEYNRARIPNIPYPSLEAMKVVVAQLAKRAPQGSKADPKKFIDDHFLKQLEGEGFIKKLWGQEKEK